MRTLFLLAATALVLAAPANAKELAKAELCGPAGCVAVGGDADLRLVPTGGEITTGPPPLGAYHELVVTMAEGPDAHDTSTWMIWYVPSAGVLAAPGEGGAVTFMPVFGESATFMKSLAKRVEPFAAPRITAAYVGGRRVTGDPGTYAQLLAAPDAGAAWREADDWAPVELRSLERSPWTNGALSLSYSEATGILRRGPDLVRLADGLAADVAAARALDPAGGGTTLLPWLAAAALLAAMVLLAGLGMLLRRRADAAAVPGPAPV